MNRDHISRSLGAAAGGLLGVAIAPVAVAFADSYEIVPDPGSTEDVTGFYGVITSPPAVTGVEGTQEFDVVDTTTNTVVGKFDALEGNTNLASVFGGTNQEILVTSDVSGPVGTSAGNTPPVDSVIDIYDDDGIQSYYSAIPSPSGDVITYDTGTGLGDIPLYSDYDAAANIADDALDQHTVQLSDGYYIAPAAGSSETYTGITGLSPYDVAVQGDQVFDVYNSAGAPVGSFEGAVTNTSDEFGNYTEAILVTSDNGATNVGTAAGDVPPVGSVFNTFYFGSDEYYDVYSDMPSSSGDAISETSVTPFGDYPLLTTFDADTALDTGLLHDLPDGYSFAPVGTEELTGVNGLPPIDVAMQGYQQFDVDVAGSQIGTIDADVATEADLLGNDSEAILVTSDNGATNVGTAAGDLPPVGSEFDIVNYGDSGFATIFSDLPASSGDVTAETVVTPFGDFTLPTTLDPSAGLTADSFFDPFPAQSDALVEPLQLLASLF